MKLDKKYSILMSVYKKDQPVWLKISIDSMLKQTLPFDEFVIVEDGPLTVELNNIIDDYKNDARFKIIKIEKNSGLGLALRLGITACNNEFIARMDADDYSIPGRIEKEFAVFEKYPELGMVGSNVYEFENNIDNIKCLVDLPETQDEIYRFSKKRCPFRHPSLLYRKSAVLKAGNYQDYNLFEDYDLYTRMLATGCLCYNVQEPLVYVRVSSDFYKRRGGKEYLKAILKFKNEQLKTGYFNFYEYLVSIIPHILVCLMPNSLRDYTYRNLLRKKIGS